MVFEKDYNNPMRWLGLGLTAVGAIPFVGSIVKGLGKLAIFHGGARAVASNAEPLLDAIRRFNPEWADIGKLRAAIDSNWSGGVTTFKESWQNLSGNIQGTIANIPTPPSWVWGLGKLREFKNEVLGTISQIQQMSNQMLDDALGRIYQEINAALDELALMVRGSDGELVPAGAGNPSRMETEPPVRGNEPVRMEGNQSGGGQRRGRISLNADNFLDSVLNDLSIIQNLSAQEIAEIFTDGGYNAYIRASNRGSRRSTHVVIERNSSVTQIELHPGGGRHTPEGEPYWRISTSTRGTIRIVPRSFRGADRVNGEVIYYD